MRKLVCSMYKKRKMSIVLLLMVFLSIFMTNIQSVYAEVYKDIAIPHGTADEWITDEMVNNEPPADYKVNKSVQAKAKEGKYCEYFLEDTLQTVYIEIDENNLNYLLQNALDEPYVMTTSVTIGDTTLGYCGLKTKGNYTLEHAVTDNRGSDRFSFTVNFGKYIKKKNYGEKQNFYGCDKISFNNFFFDKSMMKEFFALKLMDEMGIPTPQYGLAKLYINGNYYGVYAMIEAMDTSIIERHYNLDSDLVSDYLCKPEDTRFHYDKLLKDDSPLWEYDKDTYEDVATMLPVVMEWARKLNCLNDGTDFDGKALDINGDTYLELLKDVLNVDEVVKYFAVHSWLCQMDNMFVEEQNFGLYVSEDGIATIVPWDYDLSFGCYYPSTAETTANYPLDVMYRLDFRKKNIESAISNETYAEFPLFNVIYQNDKLMEQYHQYMKECSKVAALGGRIESTGKIYEPGFFNSFIEKMKDEVIEAATEKLADNVYYMNRIHQPNDVKKALPNLSAIIALRSVGVFTQVQGIDTTITASNCNLETLGNAISAKSSNWGNLTIVDSATGIFATAKYNKGNTKGVPMLSVKVMDENSSIFGEIKQAAGYKENDKLLVYEMTDNAEPASAYTLNIPLSYEYIKEDMEYCLYSFAEGKLTAIDTHMDDNILIGETGSIENIVVLIRPAKINWIFTVILSVAGAGILLIIFSFGRKAVMKRNNLK